MNIKYFLFFLLLPSLSITNLPGQELILADNARSHYSIIVSTDADSLELHAAQELQYFFSTITGVTVPIFRDTVVKSAFEILIGNNNRLKNSSLINKIPDNEGFLIATDGSSLFIAGGGRKGTLYGVYHFLEYYLDCKMYAPDAVVVPKTEKIVIKPVLDVQRPAFDYRETLHLYPIQYQQYADWHKLHNRGDINRDWGMFVHTFEHLIPADLYFQNHPEWFSEINSIRIKDGQLCLSNPELRKELIRNLGKMVEKNPDAKYWSVSNNDNYNFCTCEQCRALDKKYGDTQSGSLIWFINQVAAEFPDIIISTLAYQFSRKAPQNITPADNVNIMLCSIETNRSRSFADDPGEEEFRQDVKDWAALTHNIFMWDYVVQFRNYMNPFPNLHVLQPNLQFFANHGIKMMFEQGSSENVTEFHQLRTYLIAKLLWNPNQNIDSLLNDFLDGYYGPAGIYIRQYVDLMKNALLLSEKRLDIYGYPIDAFNSYLTPDLIEKYEILFDKAESAVSGDSILSARVLLAKMPLEFAILDLACSNVTSEISLFKESKKHLSANEKMIARIEKFVENCHRFEIKALEESAACPPEQFKDNAFNIIRKGIAKNLAAGKPVQLRTTCSPKYNSFGASALTDRNFGLPDYRYNWLGFQGNDMDAVIDLEKMTKVKSIGVDFFESPLSWIFLPVKVEFFTSQDGIEWNKTGEVSHDGDNIVGKSKITKYEVHFDKKKIRYVRVSATSLKSCPEWHRGFGQPCWIFADEVVVE